MVATKRSQTRRAAPKGGSVNLLGDDGRLREPSGPGITGVSLGIRPQWNDFIARPLAGTAQPVKNAFRKL